MNIRINLLPPKAREKKLPLKKILTLLTAGLVMVMTCLYVYGIYETWQLERRLQDSRNQTELLRPTQEKMAAANTLQLQMNAKNTILIALTKERKSWYALLAHLGTVTPPQIWLTELTAAEKNTIRLKGMAATYPDMANYLKNFTNDSMLEEAVLISAEKDGSLPVTRFEMIAKIKGL